MKQNQLKAGALLSYGQTFLSILVGVVYTPVMIRLLGQSEYGLYNTVSSTIAMLSTGSVGAGYIIYCLAGKDAAEVCSSLFGSAILALDNADLSLSVILACSVLLVFVLQHLAFLLQTKPN